LQQQNTVQSVCNLRRKVHTVCNLRSKVQYVCNLRSKVQSVCNLRSKRSICGGRGSLCLFYESLL
jgi:uncharacterized protein YjiS (DUF1127 family)